MQNSKVLLVFFAVMIAGIPATAARKKPPKIDPAEKTVLDQAPAVLWHAHTDMSKLNLYYGPGGEKHEPHWPFTFEKEELEGSSPKFVVRDRDRVKWKVKLGPEAKPEIAATRLVWAAGYFANEDYLVPVLRVENMPAQLQRGQNLVSPDGSMVNARLKRYLKDEKKAENWKWRSNAFTGTREFNGLRVMMALVNNWDLKDINTGVYAEKHQPNSNGLTREFMVNDLGASFGTPRRDWPLMKAKGNFDEYNGSRFIRQIKPDYVDFNVPAHPSILVAVSPRDYFGHRKQGWIGRRIPRSDARWIGELLGHLSSNQIRDAFRAAGYGPGEIEGFAKVVEHRIAQLQDL
jgi:hypothetical protein